MSGEKIKLAIDGKAVNASRHHLKIFNDLVTEFGQDSFKNTIITDDDCNIILINPQSPKASWGVMFFLIELLIWQRLNKIDDIYDALEDFNERLSDIERKTDEQG